MKTVMDRATSVNKDVGAQKPEKETTQMVLGQRLDRAHTVFTGRSPAETMELTSSQDREEIKPDEGDDGRRQSLINGSQVDAAFDASGQVGEVQVVFVHQVSEHHVEETCDGGRCLQGADGRTAARLRRSVA